MRYYKYCLVALLSATITLSLGARAFDNTPHKQDYVSFQLFQKILSLTKKNYVEEVKGDELYESAVDGMLRSLDPHSAFLNTEDFKEMTIQTSGEFGGVGIEITVDKGALKVVSPIDDSPAYVAGIKSQDYIIKIDDKPVRNMALNEAVNNIRGKKGTSVKLTIIREGEAQALEFRVVRSTIKLQTVKSDIKAGDIVYLRVASFSAQTYDTLNSHYMKLAKKMKQKPSGIVLDLRNNPGGLLDQAVAVSGFFLDKQLVVSTKGRAPNSNEIYISDPNDHVADISVVVLINGGSASASEIVAGALQDHKRAVVMGTKSFGKGSVQTVIPIDKTLAIRLTTATYYTPKGRSIQAEGIEPDIFVDQHYVEANQNSDYLKESDLPGHIEIKGEEKASADLTKREKLQEIYKSDYQLARAIDLLYGLKALKE
ncbi:MAG: S41 family peptidase [Rickettsiales bacterium]|jgi:carboxyl-terminal processing protease|nr:S41 family peptidase [Rickettsiales bacterium]